MTNPANAASREARAVTQADREAAADAVKAYRDTKNSDWQQRIRQGQCDDGEMVQAFARHRLAALADEAASQPREGVVTFEADSRGMFCRHCGRTSIRHYYVKGVGFACTPDTAPTDQAQRGGEVERALVVAIAALGSINATCTGGARKEPGDKARIALGEILNALGPSAYDARAALAQSGKGVE